MFKKAHMIGSQSGSLLSRIYFLAGFWMIITLVGDPIRNRWHLIKIGR
jgi:hypothetical protein